jgi:hypothetical protein
MSVFLSDILFVTWKYLQQVHRADFRLIPHDWASWSVEASLPGLMASSARSKHGPMCCVITALPVCPLSSRMFAQTHGLTRPRPSHLCYAVFGENLFTLRIVSKLFGNLKNYVFWDIKTQFVLHRRHITSPLQSPAG